MSALAAQSGSHSRLITVGAAVFVLALAVAAAFDASLRALHLIQASIYVATIVLSRRGNRWGYFLGISAAGFWDYVLLFASPLPTRFMQHPTEPDLVLQGLAWIANALVVVGGMRGYLRLPNRSLADLGRFVASFALATGALAGGIAVFSPQRLAVFAQALHPHWP
jgi:hypothetical protein